MEKQYSIPRILFIWTAVSAPMAILGFIVGPAIEPYMPVADVLKFGVSRIFVLTLGLIWQFVFTLILVKNECGDLKLSTLKERLLLQAPTKPKTETKDKKLWLWLIPFTLLLALLQAPAPFIDFPTPQRFDVSSLLSSPVVKAELLGAWWFFFLFLIMLIFNTILGEEFLFRGILLPRMQKSFGKWDWVANGVLMGSYHWHQPWMIPSGIISSVFVFSFVAKRYKSTWMSIALHSVQSVIFSVMVLGIVLGLA